MDAFWLPLLVIVALILFYFVGNALIDAYFKRKEEFVDHLQDKMKGTQDASRE